MKKYITLFLAVIYSSHSFSNEIISHQEPSEIIQELQNKGVISYIKSGSSIILAEKNDTATIVSFKDYQSANSQNKLLIDDTIPVINLNNSDPDGVSYNYFSKLNVGKNQAAYFNNRNMVTPASVIIAEVTSGEKSILAGELRVLGKEASLIVSNPMGIDCAGCSFKRTNEVTLLAGRLERESGNSIKFRKEPNQQIKISGNINAGYVPNIHDMSHISIYADKIFIDKKTTIKAKTIDFRISDGVEKHTGRKYFNGRRTPIIQSSSKNSMINFEQGSEIDTEYLNIAIYNASFINNGYLLGREKVKIDIFNNDFNRVIQNNGLIDSDNDKEIFISPKVTQSSIYQNMSILDKPIGKLN